MAITFKERPGQIRTTIHLDGVVISVTSSPGNESRCTAIIHGLALADLDNQNYTMDEMWDLATCLGLELDIPKSSNKSTLTESLRAALAYP